MLQVRLPEKSCPSFMESTTRADLHFVVRRSLEFLVMISKKENGHHFFSGVPRNIAQTKKFGKHCPIHLVKSTHQKFLKLFTVDKESRSIQLLVERSVL